jgi:hypothetical protein
MWTSAATGWDDANWDGGRARGWTVMGTMRERQQSALGESEEAIEAAIARRAEMAKIYRHTSKIASPLRATAALKEEIPKRWNGGPNVLAFLFSFPDSSAMRMLDARGEYFNIRAGETWTLFFPGYYRGTRGSISELMTGASRVGREYARDWYFSASEFDALRKYVEDSSGRRWQYSGGTDLVLINGWLPVQGEPVIDWDSTISGQLPNHGSDAQTNSLANIIEKITRDLETGAEDASYGVSEITDGPPASKGHAWQDFMINTLGGIAAALGVRALGL